MLIARATATVSARCCLIVLNYNGREHLDDCFSSLLEAARRSRETCTVVCVDNRSTHDDAAYVRDHFPDVEVVVAERNDFLFSLNAVVRARSEEVVVILNNDMRFDPGFVDPLLDRLAEPDVFGVVASLHEWDGSARQNAPRRGMLRNFWFYKWWENDAECAAHTLEAAGGASAYRRSMFVELGGFDDLYRPGYYEDSDLSYRAWERGWRSIYEPRSVIYHRESVTFYKVLRNSRHAVNHYKNHVLFSVKNLGDWRFLVAFLLLLPVRALRPAFAGDAIALRGLVAALPRLPRAVVARRRSVRDVLPTPVVLERSRAPL